MEMEMKMKMCTDKTDCDRILMECFQTVGRRYGFDNVTAEYAAFQNFKVRWQRSYRWAEFKVSDYISDAPVDVIMDLADSLFQRITGKSDEYSESLKRWVTEPSFSTLKQDLYLSRSKNLTLSVEGRHKNLMDSYNRLIGAGLVPYDPTIALSWTKDVCTRKVGGCSVLMRVVSISKALDEDEVPDYVLDYCLYHELCHIMVGFDPQGELHTDKYCGYENRFIEKEDAQYWLRKNCVYV